MKIGDCKEGDVVWFFNNVCKEPSLIRVLDDCTDGEFLMPRKNVEVIYPKDKLHNWVRELFYDVPCYETEKEAEDASKAMFNKNHDNADTKKQSKIECLTNFIKEKNLWDEYEEYEKRNYENLLNDLIERFKNHGGKQ
jgi:hypothetical protein